VIRIDQGYQKARIPFTEIENTNDGKKESKNTSLKYKDLSVHSEAEEQVVYPAVRPFYQETR
jgi:hemerythrin superfamily protein